MNDRERTLKIALGASLGLHVLLLTASFFWWMPGAPSSLEKSTKMFNIRKADLPKPAEPKREVIQSYVRTLKFENPVKAPAVSPVPKSSPDESIEKPELTRPSEKLETQLSQPEKLRFRENLTGTKEKVQVIQRKVGPDSKLLTPLSAPAGKRIADPGERAEIDVPEPFTEKMFAFTPEAVTTASAPVKDALRDIWRKGEEVQGRYGSLDRFMSFRITTWRDPSDGQGYYELAILPGKDAARLPSMPKELIVLVDASLSIQQDRIDEFTKGVTYALKNLKKEDRFNVYTFKDDVARFSVGAVPSDPATLGPALRFLRKLEPSHRTDIGRVMKESIGVPPSMLPSYILLLSDGRPTFGITSSARVIEEVSRVNARQRSIFALTGGRRVNRYLLDFLTYQNRGWSEYAQRSTDIPRRIAEFYDKIRDPLLINLRFQLSRIDAGETYPKHLPDFFRNAELVLYGLYDEQEEFSIRLLGDIKGSTKEVIFTGDLRKAKAGTPDIAKAWAFNKIYYLISRITLEGRNPGMEAEILRLSEKFGITTPYSLEDVDD